MSKSKTYDPKKMMDADYDFGSGKKDGKKSFESQDSDLSYETRDVDQMDEKDQGKFAMKGFDSKSPFGDTEMGFSQEIDDYDSLMNDPIFTQLCPKEKYQDSSNCNVCNKSFSKLKLVTKKNCKFCGGAVCEDHSKKKRPNPHHTSDYVRVCDICDEKFINKTILGEFYEKLRKKEKEINELERQIRDQQIKIENEQKEYDDLVLMRNRNEKHYTDQINILQVDIQRTREDTKKCEKENAELSKEFTKTQDRIGELDNEIVKAEEEYKKLSKEASDLTHQIEALNQDISQMNRDIRNIEEYITQNKTPGTVSVYEDSRTARGTNRNGDNSVRDMSATSSVISETPGNKKGHYSKKNVPRGNKGKGNAAQDHKSGNCETGCNIF
jgi:hypothetical protein